MSTDPKINSASQKLDLPHRKWESTRRTGSISIGLIVLFVIGMITKAYEAGFRDLSMIVAVAVAAAVLFYFLAPRLFGADPSDSRPKSWDPSMMMTDDTDEPQPGNNKRDDAG